MLNAVLGVQVNDKLLVDVLGDILPGGDVQELGAEGVGIELDPGILGCAGNAGLDDLKALGPFPDSDYVAGHDPGGRNVADLPVEGDVGVVDELPGRRAGRGDTHTVNHVVQTGLEQEEEVLTLLSGHAGSFVVGVVELTLQDSVHILHLLLLLELVAILLALLALGSEAMHSRRIVSLLEILVSPIDGFAELAGDLCCRTGISCHNCKYF